MIPYDRGFEPPALILSVTLAGVVRPRPKVSVQALIDTGADITAIPATLKDKLKLYSFSQLQLEDARGVKEPVDTFEAHLSVAGLTPIIVEVVLAPFPFVILGRDWLKNHYLLLNGPEQQFLLSEKPILKTG
jgi:predicted aspartyl protease